MSASFAHLRVVEADAVVGYPRNGPNSFALGRPNSSVKKVTIPRGFAATMVWLNAIAVRIQYRTTVGSATATMHDRPMSDVEVLNGATGHAARANAR